VISANKARCMFCQQLVYRELADQIGEDRTLLEAMLERNFSQPGQRKVSVSRSSRAENIGPHRAWSGRCRSVSLILPEMTSLRHSHAQEHGAPCSAVRLRL
jgi:hypothetical protein